MAESDPATGLNQGNRWQQRTILLLRLCWPLPGALTGAAIGFHVYFRQPGLNTDTAAPLIFAGLWAFGGMLAGMLSTGIAAWLLERILRRLLPANPLIAASLVLVCLLGLCRGAYAPLEARLPGLLWPKSQNAATLPRPPPPSPCTEAPPIDRDARRSWELECR